MRSPIPLDEFEAAYLKCLLDKHAGNVTRSKTVIEAQHDEDIFETSSCRASIH